MAVKPATWDDVTDGDDGENDDVTDVGDGENNDVTDGGDEIDDLQKLLVQLLVHLAHLHHCAGVPGQGLSSQ